MNVEDWNAMMEASGRWYLPLTEQSSFATYEDQYGRMVRQRVLRPSPVSELEAIEGPSHSNNTERE